MRDFIRLFEELENLKREREGQLSKKVHELYSWIADVRGVDYLYLFELEDENRNPEYDVYFKDERFIKTVWTPERVDEIKEVGTYYVTYSRLPKLLYTAMGKIKGYVKKSQEQFNEEFKLNRILNCIKKKP